MRSYKLTLTDDYDELIAFDLGEDEGEWNIQNPNEAREIVHTIQQRIFERERED